MSTAIHNSASITEFNYHFAMYLLTIDTPEFRDTADKLARSFDRLSNVLSIAQDSPTTYTSSIPDIKRAIQQVTESHNAYETNRFFDDIPTAEALYALSAEFRTKWQRGIIHLGAQKPQLLESRIGLGAYEDARVFYGIALNRNRNLMNRLALLISGAHASTMAYHCYRMAECVSETTKYLTDGTDAGNVRYMINSVSRQLRNLTAFQIDADLRDIVACKF